VPRLYRLVRPEADYRRSLDLLARVRLRDPSVVTKSGLMMGLGERPEEVRSVFGDLRTAGCRVLTIGQYLRPSEAHLAVARFVPPDEFRAWREEALEVGFEAVASGPFVRSSYRAREIFEMVYPELDPLNPEARSGKGDRHFCPRRQNSQSPEGGSGRAG